ncbi:MAG TPA: trehalose 6-phosphate synthase [Spirochaetota bacterium]|nr:trehalose 6-phosphate synthase [Spirochaetota bacterium]
MSSLKTLKDFDKLMHSAVPVKKRIVTALLNRQKPAPADTAVLQEHSRILKALPGRDTLKQLELSPGKKTEIDLAYEINELDKDLILLEQGREALLNHLAKLHPGFGEETGRLTEKLKQFSRPNFISDRDGTVNNYCTRYSSSVQSVYNAFFLASYIKNSKSKGVILTSAPLMNIGLADISVMPKGYFVFAGSKGREYLTAAGDVCNFPIPAAKEDKLKELNQVLSELVKEEQYEKYAFTGSGLQFKFGQTTITRQDINKTIPSADSEQFLHKLQQIVKEIDPEEQYFRIEDTGLDVEIILTVDNQGSSGLKDFDKGDGVLFLDKELELDIKEQGSLICGDTNSDLPMLQKCAQLNTQTAGVFVTTDEQLKARVRNTAADTVCVTTPDVLVTALYQYNAAV